jgi:hypothetical protein
LAKNPLNNLLFLSTFSYLCHRMNEQKDIFPIMTGVRATLDITSKGVELKY